MSFACHEQALNRVVQPRGVHASDLGDQDDVDEVLRARTRTIAGVPSRVGVQLLSQVLLESGGRDRYRLKAGERERRGE